MNLIAHPHPDRSRYGTLAKWTALALIAALIPIVVAAILLGSVVRGRPLLGREEAPRTGRTLTIMWGVGLVVIGLLQGASALLAGMSVADPTDFLIRLAASLALEGLLLVGTRTFVARQQESAL
jgi:hypothetical protein